MPLYFLKRYHKLIPTDGKIWILGKEMAFEAKNNDEATAIGRVQHGSAFAPFGELTLIIDTEEKRVWESISNSPFQDSHEKVPAPRRRDLPKGGVVSMDASITGLRMSEFRPKQQI